MQVKSLDPAGFDRWDAFVAAAPDGTFFHLAAWKNVIERAFGHNTHYLYAERDDRITGVLPLAHVNSRLFSNALISTPFCVYGGACAADAESRRALEDAAVALAQRLGVGYLELREREVRHPDWPTKDLYYTFRKNMDPDPEVNFSRIPRKQRAMVRKGIDTGLEGTIDDGVDRLYRAYSESVRNLGTPVFSRKYLRMLKEAFGDACEVLTVTHQGEVVSSVMNFYFRDEVLPYYGGGTWRARDLKANDFMYWEVMRRACERGVRVFDYGRSKKDTGSFRFKKHWGFEPAPLHYEYRLVRTGEMPDLSPANPKYQRMIAAWRRLPLPVTQWIGPWLARDLG